jgi:hypothetical protein
MSQVHITLRSFFGSFRLHLLSLGSQSVYQDVCSQTVNIDQVPTSHIDAIILFVNDRFDLRVELSWRSL